MKEEALLTRHRRDRQIAALEQTVVNLKRDRNALLHISKLPVELLEMIFTIASISKRDDRGPSSISLPLTLSHVCHSWRALVLDRPRLWVDIRVSENMKEKMFDFMSEKAGKEPLRLAIAGSSFKIPIARIAEVMSNPALLKSLDVDVNTNSAGLSEMLPSTASGSANHLEYLKIWAPRWSRGQLPLDFLAGGTPMLRYLELKFCEISWTSPLLKSSVLTHLSLAHALQPTVESFAQLLDFLRHSPQLETLDLGFLQPQLAGELDLLPHIAQMRIPLFRLKSFDLSCHPNTFCALLPSLKICLNKVRHIGLKATSGTQVVDSAINFDRLVSAWDQAKVDVDRQNSIPVECMQFLCPTPHPDFPIIQPTLKAWSSHAQKDVNSAELLASHCASYDSNQQSEILYPPWATISTASFLSNHEDRDIIMLPDPETFQQRLWSFANLRILIVGLDLSEEYWTIFTDCPVLQDVQVTAVHIGHLLTVLGNRLCVATSLETEESINESTSTAPGLQRPTTHRRIPRIPFPALRKFIVSKTQQVGHKEEQVDIQLARCLGSCFQKRADELALESRHVGIIETSTKLDMLEFSFCANEVDEGTLALLSNAAEIVVWDGPSCWKTKIPASMSCRLIRFAKDRER